MRGRGFYGTSAISFEAVGAGLYNASSAIDEVASTGSRGYNSKKNRHHSNHLASSFEEIHMPIAVVC